jgi:hypothetical protein
MELEIYNAIKARIRDKVPEIKNVRLFNNQFKKLEEKKANENPFLFPSLLLEFEFPSGILDLNLGIQQMDVRLITHLGFESYKDEDENILALKQKVFKYLQHYNTADGGFTPLIRAGQQMDFDHDNLQVFKTEWLTNVKDFTADKRNITEVSATLTLDASLKLTGLTTN